MNRISFAVIYLVALFLLAILLFFYAIQQPYGYRRNTLAILHVLAVGLFLASDRRILALFPTILVPFVVGITVHTTSILLVDINVIELGSVPFTQRLQITALIWSNIRHRPPLMAQANPTKNNNYSCLLFAFQRSVHALALWLTNYGITVLLNQVVISMGITIHDFAPHKQRILVTLTYHDLTLRGIYSVHWIWTTYSGLTSAHDVCAIVFVSVLGWNQPSEWPQLFGHVTEAYSVRRFWGIFWHRLHIAPFLAYTPSFLHPRGASHTGFRKALYSLWIFLLSAGCHALVNWTLLHRNTMEQEVRFFIYNWAICLFETVAWRTARSTCLHFHAESVTTKWAWRVLGYVWVWVFFLCTVPGWKYPLIYNSVYS